MSFKDTPPEITARTNGSSIGSKRKGHCNIRDMGSAKLFVDVSKPPFIYIRSASKPIILNYEDSMKTKELYEKLRIEWQKAVKK